jgi:hypothetical protein
MAGRAGKNLADLTTQLYHIGTVCQVIICKWFGFRGMRLLFGLAPERARLKKEVDKYNTYCYIMGALYFEVRAGKENCV